VNRSVSLAKHTVYIILAEYRGPVPPVGLDGVRPTWVNGSGMC